MPDSRFERQLLVFGKSRQRRLAKSRIAIIGCGGLGSVAAQYLAMAGVGFLKLIDSDNVELSNLNRQFFSHSDLGKPKVSCLKDRLEQLNPETKIEAVKEKITEKNCVQTIRDCDVILDCLDNLEIRLVLSDACESLGKPLVHGSIQGLSGQQITLLKGSGYLRKIFRNKLPTKGKIPVLGPAPGFIGSLQAMEAIKLITGFGKPNTRLLVFDGERNSVEYVNIKR
ncbi:MAG: HesA/MoeB/ThiF family protein [Candidatus Aenigmarchaeota archaeon]|nr:HesA/MoeB/ThiF family protein [Candidatus Aenigmarchaeota archaeon]